MDVTEKLGEFGDNEQRETKVNRADTRNEDVVTEWVKVLNEVSVLFGDGVIELVKGKFQREVRGEKMFERVRAKVSKGFGGDVMIVMTARTGRT